MDIEKLIHRARCAMSVVDIDDVVALLIDEGVDKDTAYYIAIAAQILGAPSR